MFCLYRPGWSKLKHVGPGSSGLVQVWPSLGTLWIHLLKVLRLSAYGAFPFVFRIIFFSGWSMFVEIRTGLARMVHLRKNCLRLCQTYALLVKVCEYSSNLSQIGSRWARLVQIWTGLFN